MGCARESRISFDVEVAPELTPEQLLDIATLYRDNHATRPIADRLAAKAMSMFVSSPSVNKAMETIAKTEVEWYG